MPGCLMLDSLEDGALCMESCPKLRATMATALNRPRVLGLLAFCRLSRSSALRLLMLWSEHTKDTCMVAPPGQACPARPSGFPCVPVGTWWVPWVPGQYLYLRCYLSTRGRTPRKEDSGPPDHLSLGRLASWKQEIKWNPMSKSAHL